LGNCVGERGPGVQFVTPVLERAVRVDLREQFLQIPHQTCITKDNAPISVDFLIYSKVVDPVSSVVQVANFAGASQGIATTTLRAVIGDIELDDVLSKREQINLLLRAKLDEVTERWGVKVTNVEIREIVPPREVQDAMNRQMSAEREKRALVTESTGKKQSTVLVATGEKQAAILRAEGEREAARLRSEGSALALRTIYGAAQRIDDRTMSLQYLDALKALGASPSAKFVFPLEFSGLTRPLTQYTERAFDSPDGEAPRE
jgi:regulator of protease activity HflC (stomatin/prohibitin superfamily)